VFAPSRLIEGAGSLQSGLERTYRVYDFTWGGPPHLSLALSQRKDDRVQRGVRTPTCKLGRVRLKVIPLIAAVALHNDLEQRRRLLRLLAHDDTLDVKRDGFAAIEDVFGFIGSRHDL